MSLPRVAGIAALTLLSAAHMPAYAEYPDQPITIVVPFPPGAGTDITARTLAMEMQPLFSQPLIVLNKAGAGGMIASEYVKNAKPNGYTLLFGAIAPLAIAPNLQKAPSYDPLTDFTYIASVAAVTSVIMVNTDSPYKTVNDILDEARKNPGKLTYGSFGNGSSAHVGAAQLTNQEGVEITHVPYRGSAPASLALQGGEIDMMFENMPSAIRNTQAGRVRPVAVTTPERSKLMPEVPTLRESGFDFEMKAWYGMVGPAGMPEDIVQKLATAFNTTLAKPEFQEKLLAQGAEPFISTPQEFKDFVTLENERWRKVILEAGAQVD
ncbi:Bug family tripartite tricarboxylate transporter substrate binding protein [Orrella sp. 11846]|uniref:Bug family tripartite tricarboxylate transporter substrate binding protein n=1 Tax=Orrella sp. 11846 TaxID=3409913 RepID=UPI003B5BFBFA